jgi:drug/metabolite transporter (DMT)-like permease
VSALLLAIASGLLMSLIGVAFGFGGRHGLRPPHIAVFMGLAGAAVFGALAGPAVLRAAPPAVWLAGLAVGLTQYAGLVALGAALRRGPLSPAWCAAAMVFLPVLAYARLALGEKVGGLRLAGVVLACVCVVLASLQGQGTPGPGKRPRSGRATQLYGLLLVAVVVNGSSLVVGIKDFSSRLLADGRTWMDAHGLVLLAASYGVFGLCMLAETLLRPPPAASRRAQWLAGLVAAAGSIGGFALLRHAAAAPAAVVFPANSVASLLGASVVSVLFLRERVTPLWFGMLAAGVAAVVLVGL